MLNSQKGKLSYLRKVCTANGLTFKQDDTCYINGNKSYMVVNKDTGKVLSKNHTLDSAYDRQESIGFIYSLARNERK